MTEDEKARAALELLVGIRRCPVCGKAMEEIPLAVDVTGKPAKGWYCANPNEEHYYMLDDGTRLQPGPGANQFTAIIQRDFTYDEATGKWVPDDE